MANTSPSSKRMPRDRRLAFTAFELEVISRALAASAGDDRRYTTQERLVLYETIGRIEVAHEHAATVLYG